MASFVEGTVWTVSEMKEQWVSREERRPQSHSWEKFLYESPLGTWETSSRSEPDPIGYRNLKSYYLPMASRIIFNNVFIFKIVLLLCVPWHVCGCWQTAFGVGFLPL